MDDVERLVVALEARIRDFERNMEKASGTATRTYRTMTAGSSRATMRMEQDMVRSTSRINAALGATSLRIGAFAKSLAAGFVAGGIVGIATRVRDVVGSLDDLGDAAERAGVSGERLQILRYALEQTTGSAEEADKGLEKFSKSIGELATTGAGPAKDAFAALGISIRDSSGALKSNETLLGEVAARFPRLRNESQQTAIATRLFGREAGASLAVALRAGQDGLAAWEDDLRSVGGLISGDILDKADELDRKFKNVGVAIGSAFKVAVVEVADAVSDIIDEMSRLAKGIPKPIDPAAVGMEAGRLIGNPKGARIDRAFDQADPPAPGVLQKIFSSKTYRSTAGLIDANLGDDEDRDKVTKAAEREAAAIDQIFKAYARETEGMNAALATRGMTRDAILQQVEVRRLEEQLLSRGIELTPLLTEQIRAEAEARVEATLATEKQAAAQAQLEERINLARDLTRGVAQDLLRGFQEGAGLVDNVTGALDRLNERLQSMLVDKAIDSFFDMLFRAFGAAAGGPTVTDIPTFGGPRATGDAFDHNNVVPFQRGGAFTNSVVDRPTLFSFANGARFGQMGEAGPEAIMPLRRAADGRLGIQAIGGGGGSTDIKIENHYDLRGADRSAIPDLKAVFEQQRRQLRDELPEMLRQARGDRRLK